MGCTYKYVREWEYAVTRPESSVEGHPGWRFLRRKRSWQRQLLPQGRENIVGEGIRVLPERTADVVSADETAQTEVISVTD